MTMTDRGNPAIKVRLEPDILAQLRQRADRQERGRGGGVAYYLRSLAYRDLGLPEPAAWAPLEATTAANLELGSGVHSGSTVVPSLDLRSTRAARNRPMSPFLEALYAAYQLKSGRLHGTMLRLKDLYPVLTLLPQVRQQYTLQQFGQDIHLLDHELRAVTRNGVPYRLDAGSTGAKKRSNLLIGQSLSGKEYTYYGIEFFHPDTPQCQS
jgi:hypothetical protein